MSRTGQRMALKVAACAVAFLWAFVAADRQWGVFTVFVLASVAVALGASAALDLGRMSYPDDDE